MLLLGGLSASCTKEDHSDCFNTYRLAMAYNGDGAEDIFHTKITGVDMYVFDVNNVCVSSRKLPKEDVQAQVTVLPPLGEGEYRIVCIGNAYETAVQGLNSRSLGNMTFAAIDYLNGEEVSGNDSLYWSAINYTIAPYDEYRQVETRTTMFESSHYDIHIELIDHTGVMGSDPKIELVGVSPLTDMHNVATGESADYVLDTRHDGNITTIAVCNIMRHTNHDDVHLRITSEDGEASVEVNFLEHLNKYRSFIYPALQECLIPFRIEIMGIHTDVEIEVPAWFIEKITPEFYR